MWILHKHVMHGFGWKWHVSHHITKTHEWIDNDNFNVIIFTFFTTLYILAYAEVLHYMRTSGILLGSIIYGVFSVFMHEEVIHGRFGLGSWTWLHRYPFIKRLVKAHHMHHRVKGKDGAIALGFLYAPPKFDTPEKVDFNEEETLWTYYGPLFGFN